MVNNQEFQAETELLRHYDSLSRTKATQILTIAAMFFVYFQIILNNGMRNITQLYTTLPVLWLDDLISLPFNIYVSICDVLSLPTPITTVSLAGIAFGLLIVVFLWQLIGLVWYVHLELVHVGEEWRYNEEYVKWKYYDKPLAKVMASVSVEANKGVYKLARKFSGFRIYTDLYGEQSFVNFLWIVLVILVYWVAVFSPSVLLINSILPTY